MLGFILVSYFWFLFEKKKELIKITKKKKNHKRLKSAGNKIFIPQTISFIFLWAMGRGKKRKFEHRDLLGQGIKKV